MKTNDTIKVHLYDLHDKEIQTRNYGKTFCVYEKAGKLGIDWSTCKGDAFAPFETFAPSVIFENVETGELFRFSNIENAVVSVEIV
nr:MAG TPA: hypothetical protein [Caudoviricetes sp.]